MSASGRSGSPRASHAIPGRGPVREALRAGRTLHEVVVDRRGADAGALAELADAARAAGVRLRRAERAELDRLAAGVLHQGVVALAPAFAYSALEDVVGVADAQPDLVVVLDGITDPQNLGAIARSAEAAGAAALVLPRHRSASVTPAVEKAAAGALSHLPVVQVTNIVRALAALSERGLWSVGLAGDADEPLWSCGLLDGPMALVIGSEGRGLARLTAERVDARVSIPMYGRLSSLNASAAAAVALFEVRRRRLR